MLFILNKPVFSGHLPDVTLFQCYLGWSHKIGFTVYPWFNFSVRKTKKVKLKHMTIFSTAAPPSYIATSSAMKKCFFKRVTSLEMDNLLVFYYLSGHVSELWSDNRVGLW